MEGNDDDGDGVLAALIIHKDVLYVPLNKDADSFISFSRFKERLSIEASPGSHFKLPKKSKSEGQM